MGKANARPFGGELICRTAAGVAANLKECRANQAEPKLSARNPEPSANIHQTLDDFPEQKDSKGTSKIFEKAGTDWRRGDVSIWSNDLASIFFRPGFAGASFDLSPRRKSDVCGRGGRATHDRHSQGDPHNSRSLCYFRLPFVPSPQAPRSPGRITDPKKAIITDATVTVINTGTGIHYQGLTNETGEYYVSNLPPGRYRIEVEKIGFKAVIQSGVILHVQDAVEVNFEMISGLGVRECDGRGRVVASRY